MVLDPEAHPSFCRCLTIRRRDGCWVYLAAALMLVGCSTPVVVTTDPPGALVRIDDGRSLTTPGNINFSNRQKPYVLTFTKDGFATTTKIYNPAEPKAEILAKLDSLREKTRVRFVSAPIDAEVKLILGDGIAPRALGRTPLETDLVFARQSADQPWPQVRFDFVLPSYETKQVTFRLDTRPQDNSDFVVQLEPLEISRTFRVSAKTVNGTALEASAFINDRPAGKIPLGKTSDIPVIFSRKSSADLWPTFTLCVENDQYEPLIVPLVHDKSTQADVIELELVPLTRLEVNRHVYETLMVDGTAVNRWNTEKRSAVIDYKEEVGTPSALAKFRSITDFRRLRHREVPSQDHHFLNSFAVSPEGDYLILSLVSIDPQGVRTAALHIIDTKSSQTKSSPLFQEGDYSDTAPLIVPDPDGSVYLYFLSNRGDHRGSNICRTTLFRPGSPSGVRNTAAAAGVTVMTASNFYLYGLSYGNTSKSVHCMALQKNYPKATPQPATYGDSGIHPTLLQTPIENVTELYKHDLFLLYTTIPTNNSRAKRQFLQVFPEDSGPTMLGGLDGFKDANCFNPVAMRGETIPRILFVSDRDPDLEGKINNNIYWRSPEGVVTQVTNNGSDDVMPVWLGERNPKVFYFMSNRSGAYNVWEGTLK